MNKTPITDEEKINYYNEMLEFSKKGCCLIPSAVEQKIKIGDYTISKLHFVDDIYNNAYIEKTSFFIFDKNNVPHLICSTDSGNANNNCSTPEEMGANQKAVDMWYGTLTVIAESKKGLKSIVYANKAKELEKNVDLFLQSNIDLKVYNGTKDYSPIIVKVFSDRFEKHTKNENSKFNKEDLNIRDYETLEELNGKQEDSLSK